MPNRTTQSAEDLWRRSFRADEIDENFKVVPRGAGGLLRGIPRDLPYQRQRPPFAPLSEKNNNSRVVERAVYKHELDKDQDELAALKKENDRLRRNVGVLTQQRDSILRLTQAMARELGREMAARIMDDE